MRKKALFVATVTKTHILQFHIPYLKMLKEMGWETAVASRNDFENPDECIIPHCDMYYDISFERNPIHPRNILAYRDIKDLITHGQYDIIHCHTPVGALLTRLAAIKARKKGTRVIYTAHGFHFYKGAPLKNWLLYYPAEKLCSYFTDVLITMNQEDYSLALKKMKAKRVEYVPGVGIDTQRFMLSEEERAEKRKIIRQRHGIPETAKLLLSVGEVNENKNHGVVIEALSKFDREDVYYIICGQGPLMDERKALAQKLGLGDKVIFAGYRNDVPDYYQAADIFVFPSLREGLPVSVMEAMASKLPVICSEIRGNVDLVQDGIDGMLFDAKRPETLPNIIEVLLNSGSQQTEFGIVSQQKAQAFSTENVIKIMKSIYFTC